MRRLLLCLLFLSASVFGQEIRIFPTAEYAQLTASSRACFANCQFCQIRTGFCEECFSPYFQKDVNGNCIAVEGYTIESSQQELLSGTAFTPSNVSWSQTATTVCQPGQSFFTEPLEILGPFGEEDGPIEYIRSVSTHKFMELKFLLLQMNWGVGDSLTVIVRNQQQNRVLVNQSISYLDNVPKENLCSGQAADQRYSVQFGFQNTDSTNVFVQFIPNFVSATAQWGIGTFLLITGRCHESCDDCFASNEPTQCRNCRDFFIQGSDGTCSECAPGFRLSTELGSQVCQKCPIELRNCQPNNEQCFYSELSSQLNLDCSFNSDNNYVSEYFVSEQQFAGSLFSVGGSSSTYQCSDYSVVGLANLAEPITRTLPSMPVHFSLSLYFNIFIIDQAIAQRTIIEIYIDSNKVQTLFVNTQGFSSICAGSAPEVFQTYPATQFFSHTNTQNVNITIVSPNTANWGIRDFRMSYQVCDASCLECGAQGCNTCWGLFGLLNLACRQCPSGSSLATYQNAPEQCLSCGTACRQCLISQTENGTIQNACTLCQQGYFVFEGACERLPNAGSPILLESSNWQSTNEIIINDDTYTVSFNEVAAITNQKNLNFLIAQNNLRQTIAVSEPHIRMLISFYLLKIDDWQPNDELHVYCNDLLVLRKTYSGFGNRLFFEENQNDLISYEEIEVEDNNETLTIEFEVVRQTGVGSEAVVRRFGISECSVIPVGCERCEGYDFSFKVDYNYDEDLLVQVIFNRLYVNDDADLFKRIFKLEVNGEQLDYNLVRSDSVRYFLQAFPSQEVLLQNITVTARYPQKVTTDITQQINEEPFFHGRVMQQSSISSLKSLSNSASSVILERYTPPENPSDGEGIRIFFEVVTRIVIYVGFFSFFVGCLTPCTHFLHNLQKLWVHIFVAALTIPNLLRTALLGFRESQDINIAINPEAWEEGIPDHLYYDAPAYYQDYYHDITFFRNIYSVGFAAALYLVFSLVMYFIFSRKTITSTSNKLIKHLKITFYRRPFFVLNSVLFYQYFTACLACTFQFIDLTSNTNEDPFRGINAAATIIAFVYATAYPLLHFFYLSHKEKDLYSIDYEITYRNRYHEIFYRFLPRNLWMVPNYEFKAIGFAQRFYNLLRFGELWWFAIVVALLHESPFAQAFLLLIFNFLHLAFLVVSSISYTRGFKYLKVLELLFFVGIEIIILVTYSQNETLTTDAYRTLAIVAVVFIFVIVALSLIRFAYTFMKLVKEYSENHDGKHLKVDERLRNDDFYNSFDQNNHRIGSQE